MVPIRPENMPYMMADMLGVHPKSFAGMSEGCFQNVPAHFERLVNLRAGISELSAEAAPMRVTPPANACRWNPPAARADYYMLQHH